MQDYRTCKPDDGRGGFGASRWPKAPRKVPFGMLAPRFVRTLGSSTASAAAFPAWARAQNPPETEAEAGFLAGAALARLDAIVRENPPWAGAWRRRLALRAAAASVARWVECHLPAGTVGRIDGRKRGFRNRTDRGLERSAPASNEANTPSGARRLWPNACTGSDALGPNHAGSAF